MEKRYVPRSPFVKSDKNGIKRHFHPDRKDPKTGAPGYSEEEVAKLSDTASFKVIEWGDQEQDEIIERATAAPGEKRETKKKGK